MRVVEPLSVKIAEAAEEIRKRWTADTEARRKEAARKRRVELLRDFFRK